jgi:D-sedoheptulose 7-phosphate isomerase
MNPPDAQRALYPFLYPGAADTSSLVELHAEARESALRKCRDIVALRRALLEEHGAALMRAARDVATRFEAGGRLFAFGNGGSATDAADAAADCMQPPVAGWRPLPAFSLVDDAAVLTAIANDVGVAAMFTRQLLAFGRAGDIALGFSTSGNSESVNGALDEAKRRGMLTVGFAGNSGGSLGASGRVHHCFVARTEHIPRIQEGHATLWHALIEMVQAQLSCAEERPQPCAL